VIFSSTPPSLYDQQQQEPRNTESNNAGMQHSRNLYKLISFALLVLAGYGARIIALTKVYIFPLHF